MFRISVLLFTAGVIGDCCLMAQDQQQSALTRIQRDYATQKVRAKAAYDKALASSGRDAVKKAEEFASTAARRGDLPSASAAWKFVLAVEPNHEAAKKFFQTLGTLERTMQEIRAKSKPPARVLLAGRWIRDYRNAPFVLAADGDMHMLEADGRRSDAWNGKWIVDSGVVYFLYTNGSFHAFEVQNAGLMVGIGKSKGQKLTKAK